VLHDSQDTEEIIERVAALDIGKAELGSRPAGRRATWRRLRAHPGPLTLLWLTHLQAARRQEGAVGALVLGSPGEPLECRRQGVLLDDQPP
jgi:hypothetical protein